jgi:hypothetical protein
MGRGMRGCTARRLEGNNCLVYVQRRDAAAEETAHARAIRMVRGN